MAATVAWALALCLASPAWSKHHGEDLADFVREYRQGGAAAMKAATSPSVDREALIAAAEAHRERIRSHYGFEASLAGLLDETIFATDKAGKNSLERALLRGIARREVRISQMGISITAGHDIFHNESFSHVFGRHFGAVLRTAGVGLRLRNHAVGGFGTMPSHVCATAMVGDDNDVVAWDYMMMADRGSCAVEHLVRQLALAAPSIAEAPATLWWQGGVWLPTEAPKDYKPPKRPGANAKQSCGGGWVAKAYSGLGSHVGDFGATLQKLRHHGMAMLQKGTDPLYMDPRKGLPPAADMSEPPLPPGPQTTQARRRLAKHHPGQALHRLWGLVWAHAYLGVLVDALRDGEAAAHGTPSALPKRMGCVPHLCEDVAPICLTSMTPRAPAYALEDRLSTTSTASWTLRGEAKRDGVSAHFGYVDSKILLSGTKTDGEVVLKVDVKHGGRPLVACEAPCPWGRCPAGRLPLKPSTAWTIDGDAVAPPDKAPKEHAIFDVKDTCFVVKDALAAGEHAVGITVVKPDGYAGLTHLIHY